MDGCMDIQDGWMDEWKSNQIQVPALQFHFQQVVLSKIGMLSSPRIREWLKYHQ